MYPTRTASVPPEALADVVVFLASDGVPAPANHQVRIDSGPHGPGIAQNMKDRVCDAGRCLRFQPTVDLGAHVHHVPKNGEKVLPYAPDQPAVDERAGWRVAKPEPQSSFLLNQFHLEIAERLEYLPGAVHFTAAIQHRQRTSTEGLVEAAVSLFPEGSDLQLGQHVHAAGR